MDFGEQTTGTRDEHYDLISVLYHALHGADNCNTYALDAETAGDERLAAFFREASVMQTQLADRAKGLLGIAGSGIAPEPPPGDFAGGISPEDISGGGPPGDVAEGVPPRSADARAGGVPPTDETAGGRPQTG
jgi:hypothetical protein